MASSAAPSALAVAEAARLLKALSSAAPSCTADVNASTSERTRSSRPIYPEGYLQPLKKSFTREIVMVSQWTRI
jgi:hypothetical protein